MDKLLRQAELSGSVVIGGGIQYPRTAKVYIGDDENGYERGDLADTNAIIDLINSGDAQDQKDIKKLREDLTAEELRAKAVEQGLVVNLATKADKVTNAMVGNFAGLDENGNITDSGSNANTFATPTYVNGKIAESLGAVEAAIEALPDGQAVSATVALHTAEIAALDEKKADKNGYYKTLRAGLADNLADESAFSELGMLHMTALSVEVSGSPKTITYPSKDIADGMSQVLTLEGNGAAFMQLYPAGADGLFATDSDCPNDLPLRYNDREGTTEIGYLDCAEVLQVSDLTASDCQLLSAVLTMDAARSCTTVWLDEAGNKLAVSVTEGAAAWTIEATGADATLTLTKVCRRAIRVKASEINCGASGENWWFTATKGSLRQIKDMAVKEGIETLNTKPVFGLTKPFDTCNVMDWIHYCEAKDGAQGIETQNAGTLAGAKLYQIKAVTSVNLLDPATGIAELPWYKSEGDGIDGRFTLVKPDGSAVTLSLLNKATGLVSTPTVDTDGHFVIGSNSVLTVTAASLEGIGVLATYNGSMDEEELDEYSAQTLVIDVTKIYGKLNGEGEYVQLAASGLWAISRANACDMINIAGDYAYINVKDIVWSSIPSWRSRSIGGAMQHYGVISDRKGGQFSVLCDKLPTTPNAYCDSRVEDSIAGSQSTENVFFKVAGCDTANQLVTWLNANAQGKYALATPLYYTSLIYRDNGVDIPLNQLTRSLQVCNWATTKAVCAAATETIVEGHTSVLPQSCSPVITSEYSSNIPETVDTHTLEIAALDTKVAALWAEVFPTT